MGIEEVDGQVMTEFRDDKPFVVVASEKSGDEKAWEAQVEKDASEGEMLGASPGGDSVPQAEREVEEPCRVPSEESSEEKLAVHPANGESDSGFESKEGERVNGSVDGAVKNATAAELLEDVVQKTEESEGTSIASTESTGPSAASNSPPEILKSLAPITAATHEAESAVSEVSNNFPITAFDTEIVGRSDSPAAETEKSLKREIAAAEEPTSSSDSVVPAEHQVPFGFAENVAAEEVAGLSDKSGKDLPVSAAQNVVEDASPVESTCEGSVEASENNDEKKMSLPIEERSDEASRGDAIEDDLSKESEKSEDVDTGALTSMPENPDKKTPAQTIEEAPQLEEALRIDEVEDFEEPATILEEETDVAISTPLPASDEAASFIKSSAKVLPQSIESDDAENSTFKDVVRVSMDEPSKPVDEEPSRLAAKRYEEKVHPLPEGDVINATSLTADVEGAVPSSSSAESAAEGKSLAFEEVPMSSKPDKSGEGDTTAADREAGNGQPEFADREVCGAAADKAEEKASTTDDDEVAVTSPSGKEESSNAPFETLSSGSADKLAENICEEVRIVKPQGSNVDTGVSIPTSRTIGDEASSMLQNEMTHEEAVAAATETLDEGPPLAPPESPTDGVEDSVAGAGAGIGEVTIADDAASMLQTEMTDEEAVSAATKTLDESPPLAAPGSLTNGVEDSVTGAEAGIGDVTIADEAASMLQTEMTDEEAVAAATERLDEGSPFAASDSVSVVTNGVDSVTGAEAGIDEVTIGDEVLQTEMTVEEAMAAAAETLHDGSPFAAPESMSEVTKGGEDSVTGIGPAIDEVVGTSQDKGCPTEVPRSTDTETSSNPEIIENATEQTDVSGRGDTQESTVNVKGANVVDKEHSEWVDFDHSEVSAANSDLDVAIVEPDSEAVGGATKLVTEEEMSLQPESTFKGASILVDGDALRGQSENADREESSTTGVISGEDVSAAQSATADEGELLLGGEYPGEEQSNLMSLQAKKPGEVASDGGAKSINKVTKSAEIDTNGGASTGNLASYLTPERTDKELTNTAESTPVFQKKSAVDTWSKEAPVVTDYPRAAGTNFDEVTVSTPQQQPVSQEVVVFDQAGSISDDKTALVTSTQPSHGKDVAFSTPPSYNLDEVASNLYETAEKVLEQTESSGNAPTQNAIVHTVAQIVLEQSNDTMGSSKEYIAGVVQKVAGFAQEASQSADPNILPDTVARVFDGETTSSSANQVIQPKGTASLGTMFSLFVIWCVSLCTSHMESQDLPAPALKLAAEEVASVLNSSEPTNSNAPRKATAASTH